MKGVISFILVFLFIGGNLAKFGPQIVRSKIKIEKNSKKIMELEIEKKILIQEISEYQEKLGALNTPFYLEKIGREKLKMVKEGEKIYQLVE